MPKLSILSKINFLSLGVIALLLFIPLYPKFPLFNLPGTYVAIRLEDFLVAFIVCLWLIFQLREGFPVFRERVSQLILLYWLTGALSLISALAITRNIVPHIAFLHFVRRIEYMSLFFVAFSSIKEAGNVYRYCLTIFIATLGVIIYGFGQKYLSWPVVSTMNKEFSKGMLLQLTEWTRVNSTFAGHYDLAAYLVMILAIVVAFAVWEKRRWLKVLIIALGVLTFYLLVLTASRISFVAYLISILAALLLLKKKWFIPPVVFLSVIIMFFSSNLGERFSSMIEPEIKILRPERPQGEVALKISPMPTPVMEKPVIVGEVKEEVVPTKEATMATRPEPGGWPEPEKAAVAAQRSTNIRFKMEWPRSLRAFLKNPVLGTGYSSVTLATDNDYLRLLAETGLLGFFAFALIFFESLRRVLLFLKRYPWGLERTVVIGIASGLLGIFVNALFIDVFEASKVAFIFWILMGILIRIIDITEKSIRIA